MNYNYPPFDSKIWFLDLMILARKRHVLQNKMMRVTPEYKGWIKGKIDSIESEISMIRPFLDLRDGEDLKAYLKDYLEFRTRQLEEINEIMESNRERWDND